MNIEKMREEFEVWATSQKMSLTRDGVVVDYACRYTDLAWSSWQASRKALVIELPAVGGFHYDAQKYMRNGCKYAIEAAGLKVKR